LQETSSASKNSIQHSGTEEDSIKKEIKEENDEESFDIIVDPNEVDKLVSEDDLITKVKGF